MSQNNFFSVIMEAARACLTGLFEGQWHTDPIYSNNRTSLTISVFVFLPFFMFLSNFILLRLSLKIRGLAGRSWLSLWIFPSLEEGANTLNLY